MLEYGLTMAEMPVCPRYSVKELIKIAEKIGKTKQTNKNFKEKRHGSRLYRFMGDNLPLLYKDDGTDEWKELKPFESHKQSLKKKLIKEVGKLYGKHRYRNMDGSIATENPFNNGYEYAIDDIIEIIKNL